MHHGKKAINESGPVEASSWKPSSEQLTCERSGDGS